MGSEDLCSSRDREGSFPTPLETLLALEGMCRVEILLLQTLRLFGNSEPAKKGRETAKSSGMRWGLAACRDFV